MAPASSNYRPSAFNQDVLRDVCVFLPASDVLSVELTCRIWNKVVKKVLDQRKENLKAFVFGANKWERYLGKVEKIPLPFELVDLLDRLCPFWADKRVKDTHIVFLLPKTVDESPTTLNSIGLLVQNPKAGSGGHATEYKYVTSGIRAAHGNTEIPHSLWVLMTKDVIPESIRKPYTEQEELLQKINYVPPKVLNAVTGIFTHYVATQEKLYPRFPGVTRRWSATNCQEVLSLERGLANIYVGEFQHEGLCIFFDIGGAFDIERAPDEKGTGGMREFHGPT